LSRFNYFGPRNFGVFASYYTETLLYSNFRGPLFSQTCQAREIREIKGTRKKWVLHYDILKTKITRTGGNYDALQLEDCQHIVLVVLCYDAHNVPALPQPPL